MNNLKYIKHTACRFVINWVEINSEILQSEDAIDFIEWYDPLRTLAQICEWYDYCKEYDDENGNGIRYTVRVFQRVKPEKLTRFSKQKLIKAKLDKEKLAKEEIINACKRHLYDNLKVKYKSERFTVSVNKDKNQLIVNMLDELKSPTITEYNGYSVIYEIIDSIRVTH